MTFLTFSLFLGGAAATAVPLLLHLLMRGKSRRIEFPALMFVKKRLETHRHSYRLKNLLLLFLRILTFLLLGLALARPTLKWTDWIPAVPAWQGEDRSGGKKRFINTLASSLESRDAPVAAAIVVDTSIRMDYVSENESRLDEAKAFAHWILKQLPSGSPVAVLTSERETPAFQVDTLAAEEKIERLQIAPTGRKVAEAARDALTLLDKSGIEECELYILSDLSEPGWPADLADSLRKAVEEFKAPRGMFETGKELGIFIIDVGLSDPTDSAIARLSVTPQTASTRSTISLEADIYHLGAAASRTVELLVDTKENRDEKTIRDTKTIDFPAGESKRSIRMNLTGLERGIRQGLLRFTVPDALEIDDQISFTVYVESPPNILVVAQQPLRDSSLFLRQALETVPFEVVAESFAELANMTTQELAQYEAVLLLDPSPMEPALWRKLANYVESGGGAGIFLGPRAGSLASFNDPAATEILGAKLVRQARNPEGELWMFPENDVSPILTPFRQLDDLKSFPWEAQPVFRYWELGDFSPRADIAVPFIDGRAAVLTQSLGRGRTATITTPVSELAGEMHPWNEWTRGEASWMFILMAEGITKYLMGVADRQYNFKAGEPIVLRPDWKTLPSACLLNTPSGKSFRLIPDSATRTINIPPVSESGNFQIRSGGTEESVDTGFSVCFAENEMILRRIDPERLDLCFGKNRYRLVRTPGEIELGIARRRIGRELYAAILVLLVMIFAAEYLFSNRFHDVPGRFPFRRKKTTNGIET